MEPCPPCMATAPCVAAAVCGYMAARPAPEAECSTSRQVCLRPASNPSSMSSLTPRRHCIVGHPCKRCVVLIPAPSSVVEHLQHERISMREVHNTRHEVRRARSCGLCRRGRLQQRGTFVAVDISVHRSIENETHKDSSGTLKSSESRCNRPVTRAAVSCTALYFCQK